jgi:hypothetical protein
MGRVHLDDDLLVGGGGAANIDEITVSDQARRVDRPSPRPGGEDPVAWW